MRALSFDEGIPVGVRTEILVRRHQRIERVAEAFVLDAAAQGIGYFVRLAVSAIVRLPLRLEPGKPIWLAILERGPAADIKIGKAQGRTMGDGRGPRRPPANAALVL